MAGVQEEEFDEGEVWDVLQDQASSTEAAAALIAAPARRPTDKGKKAVPKDEGARSKGRSSAPVAIPAGRSARRAADEDEEDGGEMLPPHEWLARKMERMGAVSAPASPPDQVFRGRSKGREMRKVRDAVLPKTAFSEH